MVSITGVSLQNLLKFLKKLQSAALKSSTRVEYFLVCKEKQRNKLTKKLPSVFRIKCFLFFNSIKKCFLQHNTFTTKYCIPFLNVLDQRRIRKLVKHLRWSFLRKMKNFSEYASADSKPLHINSLKK